MTPCRSTPGATITPIADTRAQRAHRAIRRGFKALDIRCPALTEPAYDYRQDYRQQRERRDRVRIEVLDAGRALIRRAADLERQALEAREAGVEALRHGAGLGWRDVGLELDVSGQAAHKRYRHLDGAEAELTIDDELAGTNR